MSEAESKENKKESEETAGTNPKAAEGSSLSSSAVKPESFDSKPGKGKPASSANSRSRYDRDLEDLDGLDGLDDLPTVSSRRAASEDDGADDDSEPRLSFSSRPRRPRRDIYAVAGRAAPQRILPRQPEPEEEKPTEFIERPTAVDESSAPESTGDRMSDLAAHDSYEGAAPQDDAPAHVDSASSEGETRVDLPTAPVTGAADHEKPHHPSYAAEEFETQEYRDAAAAGTLAGVGASASTQAGNASSDAETKVFADDHNGSLVTDDPAFSSAEQGSEASELVADSENPEGSEALDAGEAQEAQADPRRGTTDFGLLLMRLALGALLLFHGCRTLFDLGGSAGVDGLQNDFAALTANDVLGWIVPIVEIIAGAFVVLGVLAPLGVLLAIAVATFMAVFAIDQQPGAFSFTNANYEVQTWLLLAALSVGLAFSGPGRISVDTGRGWARRPLWSGWLATIVGLAIGIGGWIILAGTNPLN